MNYCRNPNKSLEGIETSPDDKEAIKGYTSRNPNKSLEGIETMTCSIVNAGRWR